MYIFKHSLFRLKITVGCLTSTYPSIHVEDTLEITVGCLVCVCVCVCCVVLWRGSVVWVCGEAWHTLSLLFSLLSLLFPFLFLYYLSFFSLFFLFLYLLLLLLLLLLFFLFLFFPLSSLLFYSLFSSLPFTSTNTEQSTDQQTRRPTLRRLNVMWRTVRSLPTNCTECSHLSSSLLSPSHTQKKERGLFITGIFPARNLFFITVLK